MKIWIFSTFILFPLTTSHTEYTRINSKPSNIVFKYRNGTTGESTLTECGPNDVCNVIHRRYWMPNLAERLCRCPNGDECSWSPDYDDYSMVLNNRDLLKFCQPVKKQLCRRRQNAASVRGFINDKYTSMSPVRVTVNCQCPSTHFWKIKKYEYLNNRLHQIYRCAKQWMCNSYDFCGYVRSDFFSNYYRCSCPEGNLCITKDKKIEHIQELMYLGPALMAYCDPWNKSSTHY